MKSIWKVAKYLESKEHTPLNNPWVKKEIKGKIGKILEISDNENMTKFMRWC